MLLVVDNYDSFTWNLVHGLQRWADDVAVVQSAEVSVEEIVSANPRGVVLSPGPGRPVDAGVSLALVHAALARFPLLGVCLGHQVLCEALGGRVVRAARARHGRADWVRHDGRGLFAGLPSPLRAARYHSLVVERSSLPGELEEAAWSEAGELMAVRHRSLPVQSVQFHPESFLTEQGDRMLQHFVASLPRGSRPAESRKHE